MLILVDKQDNAIGQAEKLYVHQQGKLHRAFSIFVFRQNNGSTEILLQQRHNDKYHCGGLWTNTCCGHPRIGENITAAAERRLYEEMGLHTQLTLIGSFYYCANCNNNLVEHELDHVLIGNYHNEIIQVNSQEIQDFRWLTIDEIDQELQHFPSNFTPWFSEALNLVKGYLVSNLRF